jgi:hypothetical protein
MLLSLRRYGYPTDAVLLTFETKILLLGALKNTVVLDETPRKFVTKLLTFRWIMPPSIFIPLCTTRMQSANFSEWWATSYQSTRYQISTPGAIQMSLMFFQSDSDIQPMWPSWMQDLCVFGPLRACVQLTSDLCVTVERHILLAGRQVLGPAKPSQSVNWGRRLARSASRRPPVC